MRINENFMKAFILFSAAQIMMLNFPSPLYCNAKILWELFENLPFISHRPQWFKINLEVSFYNFETCEYSETFLVFFKDCVVVLRRSPSRFFEKCMNDYSGAYQKVEKWAVAFSLCLALSSKLLQAAPPKSISQARKRSSRPAISI